MCVCEGSHRKMGIDKQNSISDVLPNMCTRQMISQAITTTTTTHHQNNADDCHSLNFALFGSGISTHLLCHRPHGQTRPAAGT